MMRELVLEVTSGLPENATIDDIIEAIYIRLRVEQGLKDVEEGNLLSTEELLKEIEKW